METVRWMPQAVAPLLIQVSCPASGTKVNLWGVERNASQSQKDKRSHLPDHSTPPSPPRMLDRAPSRATSQPSTRLLVTVAVAVSISLPILSHPWGRDVPETC